MFRLALFLLAKPLFATPCLAQQFPVTPGGELPVAAIELEKMPWTKIPGIGSAQEFATIVGTAPNRVCTSNWSAGRLTPPSRPIRIPMIDT
jgi:hypothetical protein